MKAVFLTLVLLSAVSAAPQRKPAPVMPPPGNPGHQTPPKDLFCEPAKKGVPASRACACKPVCMETKDDKGETTHYRQEDHATCRASCHPKSCACGTECGP